MHRNIYPLLIALILTLSWQVQAHTPPKSARIEIITPKNRATLSSPFTVKFGLQGYKVVPAGTKSSVRHKGGHHHLLIDTPLPDLDEPIPFIKKIHHFNDGETEAQLTLRPGSYTLQLLLGDEDHEPHDPPLYSKPIFITVK